MIETVDGNYVYDLLKKRGFKVYVVHEANIDEVKKIRRYLKGLLE